MEPMAILLEIIADYVIVDTVIGIFNFFKEKLGFAQPPLTYEEKPIDIDVSILSPYDAAMANQIHETLRKVFGSDPAQTLLELPNEERLELCINFVKELEDVCGIPLDSGNPPPEGVACFAKDSTLVGFYRYADNSINLNAAYLFMDDKDLVADFIKTIIHEYRHAIQYHIVKDPQTAEKWQTSPSIRNIWTKEILNYIDSATNRLGYYNQLIETDARTFEICAYNGIYQQEA